MIAEAPNVVKVTNVGNAPWAGGRWRLQPGETIDVPWSFFTAYQGSPMLQFDISSAREMLAVRDTQNRVTFDFWAPISSVDGYGRHALAIFEAMRKLGAAPWLRDAGWQSTKPPQYEAEARNNQRRLPSRVGLVMSVPYDEKLTSHDSVYKIVISQFETNRIPEFHVKAVNRADHFITTSKFQPEVWRRSGLRKSLPITVLTPGIDTDWFAYKRPAPDGTFKVLMLGALTGRKDPVTAVAMFQEASQGDPSWRFTIKSRFSAELAQVLRMFGYDAKFVHEKSTDNIYVRESRHWKLLSIPFRYEHRGDPRVELVASDDPPEVVRDYYQSFHCLLWPSKGEGVGLPPLEAMSCGMEVVMSNNSGMADYAFPEHCWPIPTSHMEPADGPGGFNHTYVKAFGSVGEWWVPDYAKGVRQLRKAFEAWARGEGKGARAAEYVRKHHTLAIQGRSVLDVVEEYAK